MSGPPPPLARAFPVHFRPPSGPLAGIQPAPRLSQDSRLYKHGEELTTAGPSSPASSRVVKPLGLLCQDFPPLMRLGFRRKMFAINLPKGGTYKLGEPSISQECFLNFSVPGK